MTECTTITSRVPMSGPKRRWPDAIGVTMIFGTPIGSAIIALAPSTAPSAPPRQTTPSSRPPRSSRARAAAARRACRAPPRRGCPPGAARRWSCPPSARHFGARRCRARCRAARPGCRSRPRSCQAERPQPIAHVRDLAALGVERADEQNGLHGIETWLRSDRRLRADARSPYPLMSFAAS